MTRRVKTGLKIAGVVFLAGAVAVLAYALLFGPLFAFSPVKFGFDELRLARCTVLYSRGATLNPAYSQLDNLMAQTEKFHRLSFKKNVLVIVCASNSQYRRFSLASGNACTIQTGTVIYIRRSIAEAGYPPRITHDGGTLNLLPPARAETRDLASFLKHELSHAILYQNTSVWKAMKIKRWLEEGLAIDFGNSHHYYGGEEFRVLAIEDGFWFNLADEDAGPKGIPGEIRYFFTYGAYGEFVKYLVETYGRESVLDFVHDYIRAPQNAEALFKSQFGIGLNEALDEFRKRLMSIR